MIHELDLLSDLETMVNSRKEPGWTRFFPFQRRSKGVEEKVPLMHRDREKNETTVYFIARKYGHFEHWRAENLLEDFKQDYASWEVKGFLYTPYRLTRLGVD